MALNLVQTPVFAQEAAINGNSKFAEPSENVPVNSDSSFPDQWNLWFKYSAGLPSNESFKNVSHIQIGLAKPLNSWLQYGVWAGQTSAQVNDDVLFANTSYTEVRTYKLTAFMGGLHLQALAASRVSIYANIGYSLTTSALTAVSTNAPINSSLSPSRQAGEIQAPAYNVGINYEYDFKNLSVGGSVGLSSSSADQNAEIKDTTIGIYIKYRRKDPRALTGAVLPTNNPFSEAPKNEPAPNSPQPSPEPF